MTPEARAEREAVVRMLRGMAEQYGELYAYSSRRALSCARNNEHIDTTTAATSARTYAMAQDAITVAIGRINAGEHMEGDGNG